MPPSAFARPACCGARPRPSAGSSVPQIAPGQFQKDILQACRAVQVCELALPGKALQDALGVLGITIDRVARALYARADRLRALHPRLVARAMYLDDLRFDVLGD